VNVLQGGKIEQFIKFISQKMLGCDTHHLH